MTIISDFQNGVSEAITFGQPIRIKYYNVSYTDDYDDNVNLTISGTELWTSGIVLPISDTRGSSEAILLQQGKLLTNDTKLYIDGSINTSGTIKIGLGSPVTKEYSLLSEGVTRWDINATPILKKLYIRLLPTGSLMGE
jgi:hypothetical protein